MKKVLYYVCKVLNWLLPLALYYIYRYPAYRCGDFGAYGNFQYTISVIVGVTYVFFWLVRVWEYRSGANRICHEALVIAGMICTIIYTIKESVETPSFTMGDDVYEIRIIWVIGIVVLSVLNLVSRGVTFFGESEKYASKSEARRKKAIAYDAKKQQELERQTSFMQNDASQASIPDKAQNSDNPYQKPFHIRFNTDVWRDKGEGLRTCDCIYYKNNIDAKDFICTVEEYEQGKVAIYVNGKRITDVKGCSKPKN